MPAKFPARVPAAISRETSTPETWEPSLVMAHFPCGSKRAGAARACPMTAAVVATANILPGFS